MSSPFISIVVPTYKRFDRVKAAVASVQSQVFSDWELIISDDEKERGKTWQWLLELAALDQRIRPIRHLEAKGQVANTNHGIAQARGTWVKLLHDDDCLLPHCLAYLAIVAKKVDKQVVLITTGVSGPGENHHYTDLSQKNVSRYRGSEARLGMYVQHEVGGTIPSSMMFRAELFRSGVKFQDENLLASAVDSWFKFLLLQWGDLIHIDMPLVVKHDDDIHSITNTIDPRSLDREFQVIRQMMQPFIDVNLKPPPLHVVQGQLRLIRAMHRLTKLQPLQAFKLAFGVWNYHSWWLALTWGVRKAFPNWYSPVKAIKDSPLL